MNPQSSGSSQFIISLTQPFNTDVSVLTNAHSFMKMPTVEHISLKIFLSPFKSNVQNYRYYLMLRW